MAYIFEIPASRLNRLAARVAKAAARAPKSGLPSPSFAVTESHDREFFVHDALARLRGSDADFRRVNVPTVTVVLENFSPAVGEWQVVGWRNLRRTPEGIRYVSDCGHVPAAVEGTALGCDHCGYSRRRLETFIVSKAGTGEMAQVGRSCADAFLGHGAGVAEGLSETWSILREFQEASREDLLTSGFLEEEVRTVLAVAHRRVRDDGFIGSAEARRIGAEATWMAVCSDLAACRRPGTREEDFPVTAADFMAADDVLARFRDSAGRDGFEGAVANAAARGLASLKDVAVLTAAVAVHVKEEIREREREAARRSAAMSEPAGSPGDRIEFVGKVRRVASFPGQWGERCYVTIIDADGNLLLWKTGGGHGLEEGMAYGMKGTVKRHGRCERGLYEGAVQTEISRVAVLSCLGPASFAQDSGQRLTEEDEEALDLLTPFAAGA